MLLIKNGRVMDPASQTDRSLDVLLDGEKIKEVAPAGKIAPPQGTEVFDATGLIVAPDLSTFTCTCASRGRNLPKPSDGHAAADPSMVSEDSCPGSRQVHVKVDKSRRNDQSRRVKNFCPLRRGNLSRRRDFFDLFPRPAARRGSYPSAKPDPSPARS